MKRLNLLTPFLLGVTVFLGVVAILIAQRLFALREEPVAPTAPKSKPQAQETPSSSCTLTFTLSQGPTNTPPPTVTPRLSGTPTPTGTPGPSPTPTPTLTSGPSSTPTPGPSGTPTPGPTSPPPGCGESCDPNNNRCPSDAQYCVDYSTDSLGPICGRQSLAGEGPSCEQAQAPTPTTIPLPQAGTLDNTIWAIIGGASFILLGLLFL